MKNKFKLTTGTKSLLFGVHQFILHPFTVWLAWISLYRKVPTFRETVCITVHDWGYWGKEKMNDEQGILHPELGGRIAGKLFGSDYSNLCLLHSRHYANIMRKEPSPLCWADKSCMIFDPWWLYLPRAWASGELTEYREEMANNGSIPMSVSHREWYRKVLAHLRGSIGVNKLSGVTSCNTAMKNIKAV